MAYALGVDWKQMRGMLGHTMLSTTTDIYVDMVDTVHGDAASKLDGWFPAENNADPEDGTTEEEGA